MQFQFHIDKMQIKYKFLSLQTMLRHIFLLSLAFATVLSVATYNKVVLTDPAALCLDGTFGAYYLRLGDPKRVIISLQGGGWCGAPQIASTLESCYSRSNTDLGSSKNYNATWSQYEGMLSDNPSNYFHNWTIAHFKYCDGSGHQGSNLAPITYKGKQLYFRGHNITVAQFESLNQKTKVFTDATHVVVTGQSAGGLATYMWTNYVVDKIQKTAQIWSIPDSGIFLDSINSGTKQYTYRIEFQNLMKYSNVETAPPTAECVKAYPNEHWRCMFAQYIHPFVRAPLFSIQSLYDSWALPNVIGVRCQSGGSLQKCNASERAYAEEYHKNTSTVLAETGSKNINGFWAPVCSNHVYSCATSMYNANFRIPANSIYSLNYCLESWIEKRDENSRHIDFGEWPNNKPCSGLPNNLQNIESE